MGQGPNLGCCTLLFFEMELSAAWSCMATTSRMLDAMRVLMVGISEGNAA